MDEYFEKRVPTINEVLVAMKAVRERITDLKALRSQTATESRFFGQSEKTTTPLYDVKKVDQKIAELQTWCTKADARIKMSNAQTQISVDVDMERLLAPLE